MFAEGGLNVTGPLTVTGPGSIGGALTVAGATTISEALTVTGVTTVNDRIDIAGKVRLGTTNPQDPNEITCISERGIQFGGANAGRELNSAQISAGIHIPDSLNIVGMSTGKNATTRKIHMWAEGGCQIYGSLSVANNLALSGNLTCGYINSNSIDAGGGLIKTNHIVQAGGMQCGWLQCNNNRGSSAGVGYFNGLDTGWITASGGVTAGNIYSEGMAMIKNIYYDGDGSQVHCKGPIITRSYMLSFDYRRHSDIRFKENIKNISQNDKNKVLQLEPKTYNMIDDETKSKKYGLIAQEVEELFPELITENKEGMKGLSYIELIPLMLEHIKDLKKCIPNSNIINIGGVTFTAIELFKLKKLLN